MKVYIKYFDQDITRIEKISQGDWIDLRAAEEAVSYTHLTLPTICSV